MASVMAIVAKAVFEKAAKGLGIGDVWATDRYTSKVKALDTLADGGSLFLVTVRPGEELWLVGVLANPARERDGWKAKSNTTPIRKIAPKDLVLEHGNGLTYETGKLGMSLQSPRVLADEDVALLADPKTVKTSTKKAVAKAVAAKTSALKPAKSVAKKSLAARPHATPEEALVKLLVDWEATRAPIVADAIDALSSAIVRPPIETAAQWDKIAKTAGAPELGGLLAALVELGGDQIKSGLPRLVKKFREDPRIASFVHARLTELAFTASSSRRVWDVMLEALAEIGDPRTVGVIAAARPRWDAKLARRGNARLTFLATLDEVAAAAAQEAPTEVAPALVAPFLSLATKAPPTADDAELARLFAEVYRDPDDDAPRLVLADALLEREDPRGELIRIQLAAKTRRLTKDEQRREKKLLAEYGRAWIGALGEFVTKNPKELTYERGFAIAVELTRPQGKEGTFPSEIPEAATIKTLTIGPSLKYRSEGQYHLRDDVPAWVRRFPNLENLHIGSFSSLEKLVADKPLPIVTLRCHSMFKVAWFTRQNFPKLAWLESWAKKPKRQAVTAATFAKWRA